MSRIVNLIAFLVIFVGVCAFAPPPNAKVYRNTIIRETRYYWGMNQNPSTFFAQIQQESQFDPTAQSKFADGLTQFTPDTAKWIQGLYRNDLGELCNESSGCPFNPRWAIRSLLIYDKQLWNQFGATEQEDDRFAFALASYNGGLGWANREQRKAIELGVDPNLWFDNVERVCLRANWACKENRDYPRKILFKWRPLYNEWLEEVGIS